MARDSVEGLAALGKALEEGSGDFLRQLVMTTLERIMDSGRHGPLPGRGRGAVAAAGEPPERLPGAGLGDAPGDAWP